MKSETDIAKRNAMIREALLLTRDEFLFVPLHHQMRPWAMKAGHDDHPPLRRPAGGALHDGQVARVRPGRAACPL